MSKIKTFAKKEKVFLIFLTLLGFLLFMYPKKVVKYPYYVDWSTILSLSGLLLLTTALKESGYFALFAKRLLKKLKTERSLAIVLILLSIILSTFMTNDITLFIIVPITLSLKDLIKNDLSRLIIMEAMAVNIGSALTPIGNPQNLFIWHQWGIGFMSFILIMSPMVLILLALLMVFAFLLFKSVNIEIINKNKNSSKLDYKLFLISLFSLAVYSLCISFKVEGYAFAALLTLYFVIDKKMVLKTDWTLILLFIVMFVDLRIVAQIPIVSLIMERLNMLVSKNVFLASVGFSQIMSNVPASIFMSNFSHNWFPIAYGVNIAGNGFFIASLANVIALRLANDKNIWIRFHKYSIVYFLISLAVVLLVFF